MKGDLLRLILRIYDQSHEDRQSLKMAKARSTGRIRCKQLTRVVLEELTEHEK